MAACGICFEPYDASARPPLLSPCGHTVCGDCVARLDACPFCRLRLPANRALPCNFALLEVMDAEQQSEGAEERLLRQHGVLPAASGPGGSANGKDAAAGMPSALVLPAEELQLTTQDLGVGGTGRVVLGYLRGREVAVKLLPLSGCPPAAREALQREVRLLARVSASCRHAVKLLGISVKEGRLALVMRRYRTSLADHLREQEGGCLAPGAALLLAQDLLRGLAELHALGVVMADLKPDNVLLDESGAPLLCDFGLGRAVSATIGPHGGALVTSPAGSINYMAPEQFAMLEGDALTPQSDLWGFGCTLLHVMTGRPPWAGLNIGQITMQVGVNRRTPQLPPGLSPAVHALLDSCLRPNPQERPSAAGALSMLVRELERQLHGLVASPKVPAAGGAAATTGTGTAGSAAAVAAARPASSVPPADPPPQPELTAEGQLMGHGLQGLQGQQVPPPAVVQQVQQLMSHQPSTASAAAAAAKTHPTAGGPAGAVCPQEAVLPVHHHRSVVQLQQAVQQLPQPAVQQQQAAPQQALQQTQLPQPPLQALFQQSDPVPTTYQPQLHSLQQLLQAPQQQSQQLQPSQQPPQQPQQAQQLPPPPPPQQQQQPASQQPPQQPQQVQQVPPPPPPQQQQQQPSQQPPQQPQQAQQVPPPPPPPQQQPSALLMARELYRQSVRQAQAPPAPPAQLPLDRATMTPPIPPAAAIVAPLQQQAAAGPTAAAMQTQSMPRHPVPAAPRLAPNPHQSALPSSSSQPPPLPALPPPPEHEEWPALSVAAARRQPQQPRQQQHSEPPQVQQQQQHQEQQAVVAAAAAAVQETTRDDELVQRWARLYKRKSLSLKVYLVSPSDLRVRKPELATLMMPIESAELLLEEGGCSGGGGGWMVLARLKLDALLGELHGKLVVPRPCRRYLLLKARRHEFECKGLTEVTEAEMRGPPGLLLVSFVDKGQEEPTPRELYVMDTRVPKLRVSVMLHGRWGAVRVEDVEVDATMSSTELGVKAAALLPPDYQQQHRGGFEPLLCGVRHRTGRLVLCEDLAGLGLFPGGVCYMRGYGRHPLDQGGGELNLTMRTLTGREFILSAWRDTVVEEVKDQIQLKEGNPPDLQRLVWSGQQLEDYRTLGDYGIQDGDKVAIILRIRGGKPVICLWPAQPTDVRVGLRLSDRWTLSSLVPRPDSCGGGDDSGGTGVGGRFAEWQVRVLPGGTLVHPGSGDREYAYLFWEALTGGAGGGGAAGGGSSISLRLEEQSPLLQQQQQQQQPDAVVAAAPSNLPGLLGPTPPDLPLPDFDPSRSFCVAGADVERWLYDALVAFGVPMRERTDFLTYWLPHMEGAAWLLLAFADPADYQAAAELRVQPAPDAALRLFMMFERLPAPLPAAAAVSGCLAAEVARLGGPLRREGAVLAMLEWGGMEVVRPRSRRQQQGVLLAGAVAASQ